MNVMEELDRHIRRLSLRPLAKRTSSPANQKLLESAIAFLEKRTIATALLPALVERHKHAKNAAGGRSWKDITFVKGHLELINALLYANRISLQEYTFVVAMAAEGIHDERMMNGSYPEFKEINLKIDMVKRSHGLTADEDWVKGEGPSEYWALEADYSAAFDARLVETLIELGAAEIAGIFSSNRMEFNLHRERGRRAFFHRDDSREALSDVVLRYEREAKSAASVQSYTAAVAMLGAAVEGLLLMRCLRSKKRATEVASKLPKAKRPKNIVNPFKWTMDTLISTCLKAGWLPDVETTSITIYPDQLAHVLREMRNTIHPGRISIDRPWAEVDERDYQQAKVIYTTLFTSLSIGKYLATFQCAVDAASRNPAYAKEFKSLAPYVDL
jgi:hypothetical protein